MFNNWMPSKYSAKDLSRSLSIQINAVSWFPNHVLKAISAAVIQTSAGFPPFPKTGLEGSRKRQATKRKEIVQ